MDIHKHIHDELVWKSDTSACNKHTYTQTETEMRWKPCHRVWTQMCSHTMCANVSSFGTESLYPTLENGSHLNDHSVCCTFIFLFIFRRIFLLFIYLLICFYDFWFFHIRIRTLMLVTGYLTSKFENHLFIFIRSNFLFILPFSI